MPLEEAWHPFAPADMVLCGTAARHAVVPWERVAPAIRRRGGRPLCLLDLAVPRDVEPAVAQLENVFLYDIDDLQAVAAQATAQRRGEIPAAERIVSEEVDRFWGWYDGLGVVPVIRAFRDRLDDLRRAELERALRRLGHLSPEDRAQVDQFSQALLNKFLHEPTVVPERGGAVGARHGPVGAVQKVFRPGTGAGGGPGPGPSAGGRGSSPPTSPAAIPPPGAWGGGEGWRALLGRGGGRGGAPAAPAWGGGRNSPPPFPRWFFPPGGTRWGSSIPSPRPGAVPRAPAPFQHDGGLVQELVQERL